MATRAVDKSDSELPREVVALDNDERWQARLEDARARREIALREKSAGKPQQKRLKPWEMEAAAGEPRPRPINPIIQEPEEGEGFDFADRVATLRKAAKKQEDELSRSGHNLAAAANVTDMSTGVSERVSSTPDVTPIEAHKPPNPEEFDEILTTLARPKRVTSEPAQLVLSDAPEVSELAARYAATLEPEVAPEATVDEATSAPVEAAVVEETGAKHRRPLMLASSAILLALTPLLAPVPQLETGPDMPPQPSFVIMPALGVTWSMQQTPVETQSGEWVPRVNWAPVPPSLPTSWAPAQYVTDVVQPDAPVAEGPISGVSWSSVGPVRLGDGVGLYQPALPNGSDAVAQSTLPPGVPVIDAAHERAPNDNVPSQVRPTLRPASPQDEVRVVPPSGAPDRPLKMTILRPSTADAKVANTIAADVSQRGHDVVRIQEVNHSIKARNLRYFFEADRREASLLADAYDADLRDFTWFRPKPSEGTAELWLTGRGRVEPLIATKKTTRNEALAPPEPQQVLPVPTVRVERRSLFERIFLSHKPTGRRASEGGSGRVPTNSGRGSADTVASADSGSDGGTVANVDTGSGATSDTGTTATGDTSTSSGATTSGSTGSTDNDTGGSTGSTDSGSSTGSTGGTDSGTSGSDSGSSGSDGGSSGSDSGGSGTDGDSGGGSRGNGNGNGGAGNGNGNGNVRG